MIYKLPTYLQKSPSACKNPLSPVFRNNHQSAYYLNTHDLTLTSFCPDRTRTTDSLGLSGTPLLRWGLGAVVIMLVISTALSLAQKLVPRMGDLVTMDMPEGRSLDVSSLAQYVFQALERYQALNSEEST